MDDDELLETAIVSGQPVRPVIARELDLDTELPYEVSIVNKHEYVTGPFSAPVPRGPTIFYIKGSQEQWTDLSKIRYREECRIMRISGERLVHLVEYHEARAGVGGGPERGDSVTIINGGGLTGKLELRIFLNETMVYTSNNNYPWYAELMSILNTTPHERGTVNESYGWKEFIADDTLDTRDSTSYRWRVKRFENSKVVEIYGPLFSDLQSINRYVPPGVDIRIEIYPAEDRFRLVSKNGPGNNRAYRYETLNCQLYLNRYTINADVHIALLKRLQKGPFIYPMVRNKVTTNLIPSGSEVTQWVEVYSGILPTRVFMFVVHKNDYFGQITKDPMIISHHNLKSVQVKIGDSVSAAGVPYTINYNDERFARVFYQLTDVLGSDPGITYDQFKYCYNIYAFSGTYYDNTKTEALPMLRSGNVQAQLTFTDQRDNQDLMLVTMLEVPGSLSIDYFRHVEPKYVL